MRELTRLLEAQGTETEETDGLAHFLGRTGMMDVPEATPRNPGLKALPKPNCMVAEEAVAHEQVRPWTISPADLAGNPMEETEEMRAINGESLTGPPGTDSAAEAAEAPDRTIETRFPKPAREDLAIRAASMSGCISSPHHKEAVWTI